MTPRRRLSALLATVAVTLAPACSASAGHKGGTLRPGAASGSGRVAYRPAFPDQPGKAFYLSGYAGANYGPAGAGPGYSPYPRTYRQATGYTLSNGFNLFHHSR